jgi:Fe-S-cluster containining protein
VVHFAPFPVHYWCIFDERENAMGEAKRRRNMIGKAAGMGVDPRSGVSFRARYAGRLGEFLAGVRPRRLRAEVPCNGCVACCYHPNVDVDPDRETAETLAHLDLVPHPNGGLALRKREDGACVHLGPGGCTIYAYRPHACRLYDCRMYSVIGVSDHYDGDRVAPLWVFETATRADRVQELSLRLAATKHMAANPKWTADELLTAAFQGAAEMLPRAEKVIKQIESMSPTEREALWNHSQEYLRKRMGDDPADHASANP